MSYEQFMQTLQLLGWMLLLFCCFTLYVSIRLVQANRSRTAERTSPLHYVLDESCRGHVHEAGHVLAHWLDPYTEEVHGAVIFRDGGGCVDTTDYPDLPPHVESDYVWEDTVAYLAGLAAEYHVYGEIPEESATHDLRFATEGISDLLADDPRALDVVPWRVSTEPPIKSMGDLCEPRQPPEVVRVLDLAFVRAERLVASHADHLRAIALAMKNGHDQICTHEIEAIMGPRPRRHT